MNHVQVLNRVTTAYQKARSNALETCGPDLLKSLAPELHEDSLLSMMVGRLNEPGIDLDKQAIYNLLTLAHRDPSLELIYMIRWEEELPEAISAFTG